MRRLSASELYRGLRGELVLASCASGGGIQPSACVAFVLLPY